MAKVDGIGRVLRASIDLGPGDVIFKELPVVVGHVRIGHKQKIHMVVYNYILEVWFQVGPSRTTGPVCLGCCLPVSGEVRCDGCQWPVNTPQQSQFSLIFLY